LSVNSVQEWNDGQSVWVTKTSLLYPRLYQNAVILPTGQIFISGGSTTDAHNNSLTYTPAGYCEIYDPGAGPSSPGQSTAIPVATGHFRPRLYHSVALLLPDARVLSLGGEDLPVPSPGVSLNSRQSAEIYSPPCLFQGVRPIIHSASPSNVGYGQTLTASISIPVGPVGLDGTTLSAVLIRPGSVTHHFDFDQRYIELEIAPTQYYGSPQNVAVIMPANSTYAPPGYYMLFIIQNNGLGAIVPSVAAWIQLL
jgi:Domain of unknown function (DUF1929)